MVLTTTPLIQYNSVQASTQQSDLSAVAQHMFSLMMRNIASDGFVFIDPLNIGKFSTPGCIIASPSYPAALGTVDQDYVFNWTRDAAIAAIELAFSLMPTRPGESPQPLIDYVNFANICQNSGAPTIGHACFTIEGQPRPWSEQSDGPACRPWRSCRPGPNSTRRRRRQPARSLRRISPTCSVLIRTRRRTCGRRRMGILLCSCRSTSLLPGGQ